MEAPSGLHTAALHETVERYRAGSIYKKERFEKDFEGAKDDQDAVTEILLSDLYGLEREGGDLEAFEEHLKKLSGPQSVCTEQWSKDSLAFKCVDCQLDPTCAICMNCFFNSNHEGHAWSLIRTGGGCCDCGDPSSWGREGFCYNHQGISESQDCLRSLEVLPEELRREALRLLPGSVAYATDLLVERKRSRASVSNSRLTRRQFDLRLCTLFGFLQRVCTTVEPLRQVVCEAVGEGVLKVLFETHGDLQRQPKEAAHGFLLALFISPRFKRRSGGWETLFLRNVCLDSSSSACMGFLCWLVVDVRRVMLRRSDKSSTVSSACPPLSPS
uniref:E3 ubiquitin-protein ligase n=1 Tax=Chromera velia CCMP2878 TaxID=1169474 RepID=A0A0G4HW57_9ALVE|eukprot:Cvel_32541.t1-p1 / transcript=Cvel_32541.t1 / gene=Cvel_32541 / organism=Chromera_velia_CCMP2878 / gene_product=E3 ubiquitin-protein ligase UBR1, putative / transcript_product=E3 ubiquitin-protein ligase UBR1, putative / location=Cvel_scaffold5085:132-3726(-) / protein_length=328 / sequence_SO=supercontig / SO=protein_coding / is_pseudo=false